MERLRSEVKRLTHELGIQGSEVNQSAQCDLRLLDENNSLKLKCEKLERPYDEAHNVLDIAKEALLKYQTTTKVTAKAGAETEDALIDELAAMETSLTIPIVELESEVKQFHNEIDQVTPERDRILQENVDIGRTKSGNDAERMRLKAELKQLKFLEKRMFSDYFEFEEE